MSGYLENEYVNRAEIWFTNVASTLKKIVRVLKNLEQFRLVEKKQTRKNFDTNEIIFSGVRY